MFGLQYLQEYINTAFISRMAAVETENLENPKSDKRDTQELFCLATVIFSKQKSWAVSQQPTADFHSPVLFPRYCLLVF